MNNREDCKSSHETNPEGNVRSELPESDQEQPGGPGDTSFECEDLIN